MAQEFVYPKSDIDLRCIQDEMFRISKEALLENKRPKFKGLMEIISSETVILTAIHNIKANKGSETPGSDGKTIRKDILHQEYPIIIELVQRKLMDKNYKPTFIRRVWIPKEGKKEKRPLGIPSIEDRIIQECIRIVIEPIFEAQFFNHSYGFRPMREASMALERVINVVHVTGYHWLVEGDISKYFDTVHHNTLLNRMKHMGVCDTRLLMLIKKILKAGIMDEVAENPLGTPQGGILSPLLANIYLDKFDQWISKQWENKETLHEYKWGNKHRALKTTELHPAFLIRYADDWVLVTKCRKQAEKWKARSKHFLQKQLKLKLSDEKTFVTDVRKRNIKFLGYEYKIKKGKSRTGYTPKSMPNRERVKRKVHTILNHIKRLDKIDSVEKAVHEINIINSMIRGLINYYEPSTLVNVILSRHSYTLNWACMKALQKFNPEWVLANEVNNLKSVHLRYATKVPAIKFGDLTIGLTNIGFCKFRKILHKDQKETPFTGEGRKLYSVRTQKKSIQARADELLTVSFSRLIAEGKTNKIYNFEYFLNRAYAFNRDKGKCRVCKGELLNNNTHLHHISPLLPLNMVNRVNNLASVHVECHKMIHNTCDYSPLGLKVWRKIIDFREKLMIEPSFL